MKRIICILLTLLLLLTLSGCGGSDKNAEPTPKPGTILGSDGDIVPIIGDATSAPAQPAEPVQPAEPTEEPYIPPQAAQEAPAQVSLEELEAELAAEEGEDFVPTAPDNDGGGYTTVGGTSYQTVSSAVFGFYVNYPSDWANIPGRYSVCYRENVSKKDAVPARFTVTKKHTNHTVKSTTLLTQFEEFGKIVKATYDERTFEWEAMNENATFMGQPAYEICYMAYIGHTEIQGYMIACAIDQDIYVYHFYAPFDRYDDLSSIRRTVRDSVYVPAEITAE